MSSAYTPIHCLRVKGLELWIENYGGQRSLVATCPNQDELTWLVNSLVIFHKTKVYQWDHIAND